MNLHADPLYHDVRLGYYLGIPYAAHCILYNHYRRAGMPAREAHGAAGEKIREWNAEYLLRRTGNGPQSQRQGT